MFSVEVRISREDALADEMQTMRTWLDHRRYEPRTFRYVFEPPGVVFQVEFAAEAEAAAFAAAFLGIVVEGRPVVMSGPSQPSDRMPI